jgi:hypothetical protein
MSTNFRHLIPSFWRRERANNQPQVPSQSSGAGPDRVITPSVLAAGPPPPAIQVSIPTQDVTTDGSSPHHGVDHSMLLSSLPDLHRAGVAESPSQAISSSSTRNANQADRRMPHSMPDLNRVGQSTASEASSRPTTITKLKGFPVAHRLTKFAQDLFLDSTYQEPAGAWMDYRDEWNLTRMSSEAATEVLNAHKRRQTHIPENQRERVEAGL